MRPSFLLIALTFIICSCSETEQVKVQSADTLKTDLSSNKYLSPVSNGAIDTINQKALLPDSLPNVSPGEMILISSGQMSPYTKIKIGGCDFDLVMNDNDTVYLATSDKRFLTPEGYKVETKFSELRKEIKGHLTREPGWGYYYKLSSGWTLGFCEGNSCTDNFPKNSSRVKWIFKRN